MDPAPPHAPDGYPRTMRLPVADGTVEVVQDAPGGPLRAVSSSPGAQGFLADAQGNAIWPAPAANEAAAPAELAAREAARAAAVEEATRAAAEGQPVPAEQAPAWTMSSEDVQAALRAGVDPFDLLMAEAQRQFAHNSEGSQE
jgi:hypothetical protein